MRFWWSFEKKVFDEFLMKFWKTHSDEIVLSFKVQILIFSWVKSPNSRVFVELVDKKLSCFRPLMILHLFHAQKVIYLLCRFLPVLSVFKLWAIVSSVPIYDLCIHIVSCRRLQSVSYGSSILWASPCCEVCVSPYCELNLSPYHEHI